MEAVEKSSLEAKTHFLKNIRQMGNNAVLIRRHEDGRLETVYVSPEFAAMMECSVEEAMALMNGLQFYKSTNPEDRPLVRSMLQNRVAYDGGMNLTIQKITAKKNRVWCNVHCAFIEDFGESYIYCTYSDVTALKQYENRLRTTYSSLGNNFYHVNERTLALLRVNLTRDTIEEVRGKDLFDTDSIAYTYSESLRQRAAHFPIQEERSQYLQRFDRESLAAGYLDGRNQASLVLYSLRKDGRSCFVNVQAAITRHPLTGDLVAFLTEQECNSEKVKSILTDKILAQQFDMVCYLADGKYGVTIGELAQVKRGNIFPATSSGDYQTYLENQVYPVLSGSEEEREAMRQALTLEAVAAALRVKEPYMVDIAIELEGETFYKQFDFYSVDPEANFYILLKSDTTELQQQHRTMNEHLRSALEAATQANVAKTAFLSSMSHEIRTPMNAIIGLDNIALAEPGLTDTARDHLEKIGASARHLLGLINDILDMSRIESGRMALKNEEFRFADMLAEINTMMGSQCREKGLIYEHEALGAIDDYYIGDVMKIKQVLINILGNAVKFTPVGGKVTFRAEKTGAQRGQADFRFTVQDTGIGMEAEYLPRIFDPFSQERESMGNRYGSTGLGLAITKSIVEIMNGTIQVQSRKGEGSQFTVTIALTESDRPKEAPPEEATAETPEADLSGRRILLAEDIFINAEIMKQLLSMREAQVDHAENGKIALEMFENSPEGTYDAVLMDIRMPEMDGIEATRAIRALPRGDAREIPIIALTANAFDEDVQQTLRAGMDAHLSKPVEPDQVYDTLSRLIRQREEKRKKEGRA
ncbi:MAG: response regulator [Clostridia bacterium]|nr:response regulator [Clostridia bacterium]